MNGKNHKRHSEKRARPRLRLFRPMPWLLCAMIAIVLCAAPVPSSRAEAGPANAVIAVVVGTTSERTAEATYPEAKLLKFDGLSDAVAALEAGKADYVLTSYTNCVNFARNQDDLAVLDIQLSDDSAAIAVQKSQVDLLEAITGRVEKYLSDGTMAKLKGDWIRLDGSDYAIPVVEDNENGPELHIAISAEREPMCFVSNGEYTGLDISLIRMICNDLGYRPVFHDMKFSAMIPSVLSGKTPVAISNLSATEERRESVSFSPDYFYNPQTLLTRKELVPAQTSGLDGLNGQPMGVQTGTVFDVLTAQVVPDSPLRFYNTSADMIIALTQGNISGYLMDEPVARLMCAQNSALAIVPQLIRGDDYGFAFSKTKTGEYYCAQMSDYLAKLRSDGTLEHLAAKWMDGTEHDKRMEDVRSLKEGKNGVIRIASSFDTEPFSYLRNNEYVGYEMDLVAGFCREYGYGLEINSANFDALIPGLVSGSFDIVMSCITITQERAESVFFSTPIYNGGVVMVRRAQAENVSAVKKDLWRSLKASFEKNFIREQRWKLLLSGIGITMLISLCSALLGGAIGFGVCMLRRNRRVLPSGVAKVFIRIIQGTPIVVLLMILYYVILNKTGLDGVSVAIIAFGINFGAYAAEILRSGLDAVDPGQLEAAAAIGFSKSETFKLITLPQAARHFLPVLKGEFISLVKMTSVVGYVAVQDLTKASDIIRSRTYEAFFPLIISAILYFFMAWGLSSLLTLVELKTDPKARKRALQRKCMKNAAKGAARA